MTKVPYAILHAFTTAPEAGNPAAVVVLPEQSLSEGPSIQSLYPSDETLLKTAQKFDKPMTGYIVPLGPKGQYTLRWFNPAGEAWICGHATLAVSSYLFSTLEDPPKELSFQTVRYGEVKGLRVQDPFKPGEDVVGLDFPELRDFKHLKEGDERYETVSGSLKAAAPEFDQEGILEIHESDRFILFEMKEEVDLKSIKVDCSKFAAIAPKHTLFTQVASAATDTKSPHIHSRCFGTDPDFAVEDTATGSAHCAIIPYFLSNPSSLTRLQKAHPSSDFAGQGPLSHTLRVKQLSERGGEMSAAWMKEEGRGRIMGRAVKVEEGEMDI